MKLTRLCMACAAGFLITGIAWTQETPPPQVDCIALTAKIVVDADTFQPYWDIAAVNGCGKDITAYSLAISDLAQVAHSGADFTRFLQGPLSPSEDPYAVTDVWRAGATLRLRSWPFSHQDTTGGWVVMGAALFADRSSGGDPEQVSGLIRHRGNVLAMYQGFRESWAYYLECPEGFGCLERALNGRKDVRDPRPDVLEKGKLPAGMLASAAQELGSRPERWREYVQERVRELDGIILLYKQHLAIEQNSRP